MTPAPFSQGLTPKLLLYKQNPTQHRVELRVPAQLEQILLSREQPLLEISPMGTTFEPAIPLLGV